MARIYSAGATVQGLLRSVPPLQREDPVLIFAGSFNPLHDGHCDMLNRAVEFLNKRDHNSIWSPKAYLEISVSNAEKGPSQLEEILERAQRAEKLLAHNLGGVIVSDFPLFSQKAEYYPLGSEFIVGSDTAFRIVDRKYGWSEELHNVFLKRETDFLVFSRRMIFEDTFNFMVMNALPPNDFAGLLRKSFFSASAPVALPFYEGVERLKVALQEKTIPPDHIRVQDLVFDTTELPQDIFTELRWEECPDSSRKERFVRFVQEHIEDWEALKRVLDDENEPPAITARSIHVNTCPSGLAAYAQESLRLCSDSITNSEENYLSTESGPKGYEREDDDTVTVSIEWRNGRRDVQEHMIGETPLELCVYATRGTKMADACTAIPAINDIIGISFEHERHREYEHA